MISRRGFFGLLAGMAGVLVGLPPVALEAAPAPLPALSAADKALFLKHLMQLDADRGLHFFGAGTFGDGFDVGQ